MSLKKAKKVKSYILTSSSQIKIDAIKSIFPEIISIPCDGLDVEQPIGMGGLVCCKQRIIQALDALTALGTKDIYSCIVSVENAIEKVKNVENRIVCFDVVHVLIYNIEKGIYYYEYGGRIPFDSKYLDMATKKSI